MQEVVWMEVTNDEYELPVAVADSVQELAEIRGRSVNSIYSCMNKAALRGSRQRFVKVEVKMSIRAIVKRPEDDYGQMVEIENDLTEFQEIVDGYIETIEIDGVTIICNEEGKLFGMDRNMKIPGDVLVGTIIVCGEDEDEFADIPITMDEWKKKVDAWNE